MRRYLIVPFLLVGLLSAAGCATAVMSGMASGDKDYQDGQRDARITREVRTQLYRDALLGDERLQVSTAQGVVTLRGSVGTREEITRAMEIVNGVAGVQGVNIQLVVNAAH